MGSHHKTPSVTVITPSMKSRYSFKERIISCVSNQDYPNIIEHLFDYSDLTIGAKRNRLCASAIGDIIVHADDDDIYTSDWVSKSVETLLSTNADCTGLRDIYLHDGMYMRKYTATRKIKGVNTQVALCGATLSFWRKSWLKSPFDNHKPTGEDAIFCATIGKLAESNYIDGFLATLHGGNTSSNRNLFAPEFSFINDAEQVAKILSKF